MTVKIISDELFEAYKDAMTFPTKFTQFKHFCNIIGQYNDCDDRFMQEVMNILNALMTDGPVELVESKLLVYAAINNIQATQYYHVTGSDTLDWGLRSIYQLDRTESYQFTQSEVDELKKKYPYIQTKEIEE